MAKVRAAVVGCGGRGRGHIEVLQSFEDVDVVAICDPLIEGRDKAGEAFAIERRYASIEEMLSAEELDAAVVATPAHLNAVAALPLLERGIDTLLEKPPGLELAETKGLRQAAQRSGAKGMVAWDRRFHPLITQARQRVEERGPITQLLGEFHKNIKGLEARGHFPPQVMDNMLLESPIHSIDVVRAIAGSEVAEVHSVVRRSSSSYKDVHAALISFENGCVAQICANYTTDARLERYEIHGCGISAYLEGVRGGVVVCDGEQYPLDPVDETSTQLEDRYFIDCVKEDRPIELPAANLDEAVKTMELAHAILAGLQE